MFASGKAPSYDNISMLVIKHSFHLISAPLANIINLSSQKGIFPDKLKIAKVIPICKVDDPSHFKNYGPTSLLSNFSKFFEKGTYNRMIEFAEQYTGPYLGFFVCGGKLGFREISDQYSYKKQPSKIRHYVRKKTFSFPGGGNCPLRPPAMYGPGIIYYTAASWDFVKTIQRPML